MRVGETEKQIETDRDRQRQTETEMRNVCQVIKYYYLRRFLPISQISCSRRTERERERERERGRGRGRCG